MPTQNIHTELVTSKNWSLREELYRSFHQWPTMLVFMALGCLAGWLGALIWPTYYKAIAQVYVGLNPYRAFSDTTFLALALPKYSNLDDYKNWQMSQLETAIFRNDTLQATLEALRQEDASWQQASVDDLRQMLAADWRSAGTWSLIAEDADPQKAAQAADAWSRVAVATVQDAVQSARQTFILDQELQAAASAKLAAYARHQALAHTKAALLDWLESARELPHDQLLEPNQRWQILLLATSQAQFTPAWQALLAEQPGPQALPEAYSAWIEHLVAHIDVENASLQAQIEALEKERASLAEQYNLVSSNSLGFSPNLEIEGLENLPPTPARPTNSLIIIGGVTGLLVWALSQLARITRAPYVAPRTPDREGKP